MEAGKKKRLRKQAPCNHQLSEFCCFLTLKVYPGSFVFDPFVGTGNYSLVIYFNSTETK